MNLKRLAERLGLSNEDKQIRVNMVKQDKFMTTTDAEKIVEQYYVENAIVALKEQVKELQRQVQILKENGCCCGRH